MPTAPPRLARRAEPAVPPPPAAWTFLTNHAHVLVCLAHDSSLRLRDVALSVGITERAVQHIVADLEAAGVLTRARVGRRNRYALHPERPLRHPIEAHRTVAHLLAVVLPAPAGTAAPPARPAAARAPAVSAHAPVRARTAPPRTRAPRAP